MRFSNVVAVSAIIAVAIVFLLMFNKMPLVDAIETPKQLTPAIELPATNNEAVSVLPFAAETENYTATIEQPDYYSKALSLLPLAEEGDAEARFQLAEVISHCETINAWKADFERDFPHFKAMNVSDADLRYMEGLTQEAQKCAAFDGQVLDIFSGQPITGLSGLQIVSLWHLQAAMQGHQQAAINGLHSIPNINNINLDTKLQLKNVIEASLPSLIPQSYFGLAAHADSELSQLALVKLGCTGNIKCDNIESVPFAHINFYGCMKSGVDEQISGISTETTNCAEQGLNHFITQHSSNYSEAELSARVKQIQQAAYEGDMSGMGLSAVAEWLETDDSTK